MSDTIPLRYVGKKDFETDHLYGTNITWRRGEVHDVPANKAALLLQHTDVWADARATSKQKKEPVPPAEPTKKATKPEETPAANFATMNLEGLRHYAQVNFNEYLPDDMAVEDARARVVELVRIKGD